MADQKSYGAPKGGANKSRVEPKPAAAPAAAPAASASAITEAQAKEFHEQFKVTYTAFVGLAAIVHLFLIAAKPWF